MADTLVKPVENLILEDVVARQKKERKDLQSRIMQIKKAVPKGDKRRQKETQLQVSQMECEFDQKCHEELSQLDAALQTDVQQASPINANGAITPTDTDLLPAERSSKAEKRREKKRLENIEREKRIQEQEQLNVDLPRAVEERQLKEKLLNEGLEIHDIVPDGNCLFSAVAHQLGVYGQNFTAMEIRRLCAENLRENRSQFEAFIVDDDYNTYCDRVESDQTCWGGQIELLALSNQFKCKIIVYQSEVSNVEIGDDSFEKKVRLSFHRHLIKTGEHYNSLIKAAPSND